MGAVEIALHLGTALDARCIARIVREVSKPDVSQNTTRFVVLDSWRGILALCIALFHLPLIIYFPGTSVFQAAPMAVDFFFVLSGFVIAHATRQGLQSYADARWFMLRRFHRLWPVHIATLAIIIVVKLVSAATLVLSHSHKALPFASSYYGVGALMENVALLQGFFASSWNFPSWSISVEFWVYVTAAINVLVMRKNVRVGAATFVLLALALVAVEPVPGNFVRCLLGFYLGVLAYHFRRDLYWGKSVAVCSVAELCAVAMIFGLPILARGSAFSAVMAAAFVWPIAVFAQGQGCVSSALKGKRWQRIGMLSYCIYMVHVPMIELLGHWLSLLERATFKAFGTSCEPSYQNYIAHSATGCGHGDTVVLTIFCVIYLFLVIGAAGLLHRYVEKPFLSRRRPRVLV